MRNYPAYLLFVSVGLIPLFIGPPADPLVMRGYLFTAFVLLFCAVWISYSNRRILVLFGCLIYLIPYAPLLDLLSGDVMFSREVWFTQFINRQNVQANLVFFFYLSAFGYLLGYIAFFNQKNNTPFVFKYYRMLSKPKKLLSVLYILTVLCFVGIYYIAPSGSIISSTYSEVIEGGGRGGFSGLGFVIYGNLILMMVLSERVSDLFIKKQIYLLVILVLGFSVIYADFLRGDRNTAPVILACIILVLTRPIQLNHNQYMYSGFRINEFKRLLFFASPLIFLYLIIPSIRATSLSNFDFQYLYNNLSEIHKTGVWIGAFRSMVGLIVQSLNESLIYGKTYFDYILYLPPSFVYDILPLARPEVADVFAAYWYTGFTSGGTHPTVTAYRNFGYFGVFLISFIISYYLIKLDSPSKWKYLLYRILYGVSAMSLMRWFWYGDLYFIRAIMAGFFAYYLFIALNIIFVSNNKNNFLQNSSLGQRD